MNDPLGLVSKVSKDGKLHPLQLQVDKVQFYLDKMFEGGQKYVDKEFVAQGGIIIEFLTEVSTLYQAVLLAFLQMTQRSDHSIEEGIDFFTDSIRKSLYQGLDDAKKDPRRGGG